MKIFIFIVGLLFTYVLSANTIKGKVTNSKKEPISNAYVYWAGSSKVVLTGYQGEFEISEINGDNNKLIANYVGYLADTIEVETQGFVTFILQETKALDEVVIEVQRKGVMISSLNPIKVEQITATELRKSACCDLSGCFETQTTVQAQTTNIITNSKELRILGLSGVYNQILIDGMPMIQGLTYTYGISSIPGILVENIHISKGANSVLQGYESISGQINVELKEPANAEKLFLNLYINSYAEKHLNAYYTFKKKKWSILTSVHTVQPSNKIDNNDDNFMDLPLLTRYMLFDKWKYGNEKKWGWNSSLTLRYVNEQRSGGQKEFNSKRDNGSTNIYGQSVNINQPEIIAKIGHRLNDSHNFSLQTTAFYQEQKSYFGTVKYDAVQTNFYSNFQYTLNYSKHSLNMGASFRHLRLNEDISFSDTLLHRTYAGKYNRQDDIPGLFAENTLLFLNNRLTFIAGIRGDNHNIFGFKVTPRLLVKFDISQKTTVRANVGTGWRTVNLFSENIGLLASSRDIILIEKLKPEEAVNLGLNFTQKFDVANGNLTGYFSADYYHTNFKNQIYPDYDTDPTKAIVKNFAKTSISNGFQAELNLHLLKLCEFKFGYNFLDVFSEVNGIKKTLPFNPKHRFLATFSLKPKSNKFHFDVNMHWIGEQGLPDTKLNPLPFRRPDLSKPYTVVNTQFTYNFNKFEVYTGCENIFNFTQKEPIISWQNPFSPYFDTSSAWGPTRGREVYVGIKIKLR